LRRVGSVRTPPRGYDPPSLHAALPIWPVADRGDRFAGIEEGFCEGNRRRLDAKRVGIDDATRQQQRVEVFCFGLIEGNVHRERVAPLRELPATDLLDRKSTRLNSSHVKISYAVFCLRKKKNMYKAMRCGRVVPPE